MAQTSPVTRIREEPGAVDSHDEFAISCPGVVAQIHRASAGTDGPHFAQP